MARRKQPIVARALVAKELARIVYYVMKKKEAFNGTTGTACSQASTPIANDRGARRRAADLPLGPIHAIVNP